MQKILAFIPARGGSKGIPKKNLYPINGKPLIYYTIDLIHKLKTKVIPFLSTDSIEIKNYYELEGFSTDYLRPDHLASDTSTTIDAVLHGLNWYEENFKEIIDSVLLLQPTSPIRIPEEVDSAIEYFYENNLNSLVSVTNMREHPFECMKQDDFGWNYLEKPNGTVTRRQDYLGKFYFLDGSFYLARTEFLKNNKSFVIENETYLFESKLRYSIDIDELEDMKVAEAILAMNLE